MKESIKVVSMDQVPAVPLGNGSWSRLVLTGETVGAQKAMLGYSVFTPGTSTPQKVHAEEELAYVLCGHGELTIGDEAVAYGPRSALYIPAGVPHGVRNSGTEDVIMVFVFSHPGYPPTSDAPTHGR
ncbi:MAG: cupin domain-containing protein [Chloroflexi bacterium]|nr:cupin domain-containing protein [Chloroflexota bacterium]MDA8187971.1 cupin domain-containing protein [Dehalococcoidales bacterium]